MKVSVSSKSIFRRISLWWRKAYSRLPSDSPIPKTASVMQLMAGYRTQSLKDFKGVKGVISLSILTKMAKKSNKSRQTK